MHLVCTNFFTQFRDPKYNLYLNVLQNHAVQSESIGGTTFFYSETQQSEPSIVSTVQVYMYIVIDWFKNSEYIIIMT